MEAKSQISHCYAKTNYYNEHINSKRHKGLVQTTFMHSFLKMSSSTIASLLTYIFNCSVKQQIFPKLLN